MSKKFLSYFLVGLGILAAAVLWLLAGLDIIKGFSLAWVVVILCGVTGLVFILNGLFMKTGATPVKKMFIIVGAGLLVGAVFALATVFTALGENKILYPVIAIIAAVAILFCLFATGGKAWDEGDNQKAGYKNYYERKAEEEKKNKKDGD